MLLHHFTSVGDISHGQFIDCNITLRPTRQSNRNQPLPLHPLWFRGPRTCVGVKPAARLGCVLRGSATGCFEVLLDVQACVADLSQRAGERGQERVQKAL